MGTRPMPFRWEGAREWCLVRAVVKKADGDDAPFTFSVHIA